MAQVILPRTGYPPKIWDLEKVGQEGCQEEYSIIKRTRLAALYMQQLLPKV